MSYLLSAGIVVVGIVLLILAFKLLRGLIKTAIIAVLLGLVVFGGSFMILYQDYQTVQTGLAENAVIQFTYQNETISAINITEGSAAPIPEDNTTGDITFLVSYEAFDTGDFIFNGNSVSDAEAREIFEANTVSEVGDAVDMVGARRIALRQRYDAAGAAKDDVILLTVSEKVQSQPNEFLLGGIRDGTITVKPTLLTVRFINYIPDSIIDRAWGTAKAER